MVELEVVEAIERVIKAAPEQVTSVSIEAGKMTVNFAQPPDAEKLEQAYNNSPVTSENPDAQMLERALNGDGKNDAKIEIEAEAAYKTKDTIDIHLEHKEKTEVGAGIEGTPTNIADLVAQMGETAPTTTQLPNTMQGETPPAMLPLDVAMLNREPTPELSQELNMLQPVSEAMPTEIATAQNAVSGIEQFVDGNAVITISQDSQKQPTLNIQFDEKKVDLTTLQQQLNAMAEEGLLGENGKQLEAQAMQQINAQFPSLATKDGAILGDVPQAVMPKSEMPTSGMSSPPIQTAIASPSLESPDNIRKLITSAQTSSQISPIDAQHQRLTQAVQTAQTTELAR